MSDPRLPSASDEGPGVAADSPSEGLTLPASPERAVDRIPRNFGRYRIQDRLGKGGMGAVFRAHDTELDRTVALKVPFLGEDDAELRQRFYREARAAAGLHHANICPVYDVGELHGLPYLTMAFIEGRSLAQLIEAGPLLTPARAALLVRKVALAMHEAHSHGVVHRDLKPANIILRPNGEPVVMDFGLARRADDRRSEGLTRQGEVLGTLEYMPPEQLDGDNAAVGPAADIYALGVVLYELLTGRRPFTGNTVSMLTAILLKPPPRPGELRAGVPEQLEEICLKAMARRPQDRYASMGQFATALGEFLRSPQPDSAPTVIRSAAGVPTPGPGVITKPIKAEAAPKASGSASRAVATADAGTATNAEPQPAARSSARRPRSGARRKKDRKEKEKKKSYLPFIIGGGVAVLALGVVVALIAGGSRDKPVASYTEEPPASATLPPGPPSKSVPKEQDDPGKANGTDSPKKKTKGKSGPPSPAAKKQQPARTIPLKVALRPETVALAVGEQREVTAHIDRGSHQGPLTVQWTAPKGVRVSPAGPLTVQPGEPDPVLKVMLTAEPEAGDPRLVVTASPSRDSASKATTAALALQTVPGPCLRVIELMDGPVSAVKALAFAPDASLALIGDGAARKDGGKGPMASGKGGHAIEVWDLLRGEPIAPLAGHSGPVTELAISADARTALSVSADQTVALWDLAQGKRLSQSPKQPLRVITVGMSPEARRALVVYPEVIYKVDLEKFRAFGQPIKTAQLTGSNLPDVIRTAAVSARQGLVGGLEGKLYLLDLADKSRPRPLTAHQEAVRCAAFSLTGDLAATGAGGVLKVGTLQPGQENTLCLWDTGTASLRWKTSGHTRPVVSVAFSSDGRFVASGGADGEIRVWHIKDGKPVATFAGHTDSVLGLVFTPEGKELWSGSADRTIRKWKLP